MYNGIGITTARGTGTNGYVQANLSNLLFSRNKITYNTEEDIAKAEAEVNREPNAELLDHEFKRAIEIKCVEFEDLMEGKGISEAEIHSKVAEYRQLLYDDLESGRREMVQKGELDLRNSHSRAKVAKDARDRFRAAVGIDAAFVDGSSLEKLRKAGDVLKAATADGASAADADNKEELEKSLMQKVMDKLKKAKAKKRQRANASSSSSSESSSESDSDTSSPSSDSSDSEEEERKKRKKAKSNEKKKVSSSKSKSKRKEASPPAPKFKVPKQEVESVRSERHHPLVVERSQRERRESRGDERAKSPPRRYRSPQREQHSPPSRREGTNRGRRGGGSPRVMGSSASSHGRGDGNGSGSGNGRKERSRSRERVPHHRDTTHRRDRGGRGDQEEEQGGSRRRRN